MVDRSRVEEIFKAALKLQPAARPAFLSQACGGDAHQRARVEELLAAHVCSAGRTDGGGVAGSYPDDVTQTCAAAAAPGGPGPSSPEVGSPAAPAAPQPEAPATTATQAGPFDEGLGTVGRYKLLQQIGEGGFGLVFLAEQRTPVHRRVALKIIKLGMDTRQVVARFEAERQALALMEHPNIAKVMDAGETETGRPYFVMELVPGVPITEYCDRNHLTIGERLELLVQVCRAVQHAHTKGIIHRDLKPGNVLVSTQDGRPVAKVIDFGIAKATHAALTDKTLLTGFHQLIGTPAYMSPEQAEGSADLDTRTDVYSLGVLLYELLTGSTPFSPKELLQAGISEVHRIIREVEPPRPSTRLSQSAATLATVAANRRIEPSRLRIAMHGELDWIVMKCIDKDRARRYDSVGDLSADLTRYRSGEAVAAAPPSAAYRVRKFTRRHRAGVVAGALVAAALLGGLSMALVGLRSAVRARDAETAARRTAEQAQQVASVNEQRALAEAAKSSAVLNFVTEMFSAIDPVLARGHAVTVAEVLDPAAEKVGQAFAGQPDSEAIVRGVLGQAYVQVGRYAEAERELGRAWDLRSARGQVDDPAALTLLHNFGVAVLQAGDVDRGRTLLQQACEQRSARLGPLHHDTLETRSLLAVARQRGGDVAGAITDIRAVLADQERALGRTDRQTIESLCSLADLLESADAREEALATAQDAAQRATAAHGAACNLALMAHSIEAETLLTLNRPEEAAALLEQVVQGKEKLYGENHPGTLVSLDVLARALEALRQDQRAITLHRTIASRATQGLGERHPETLTYLNNLAQALRRAGQLDEAEPIYRRVLALRREINGERGQETLIVMSNLGLNLMQRHAAAEALPLLREALDGFRAILPAGHWIVGVAQLNLGRCEAALGHHPEAEALLTGAHTLLKESLGATNSRTVQARAALAELYEAWGQPAEAQTWRNPP
jgi:eukaryotic-like serine/threonine-protein kinase